MIKIKTTLLGSALAVALSATPVIAADFHALAALGATPAPLEDGVLASTEGGDRPDFVNTNGRSGQPQSVNTLGRSGRPDLVNTFGRSGQPGAVNTGFNRSGHFIAEMHN